MGQYPWNSIDIPKIDSYEYRQLFLMKDKISQEKLYYNYNKKSLFNNGDGTTGHTCVKKKKNLDTDLMPVTKTNSKWIIGLNVKCQMQSFKTPKR